LLEEIAASQLKAAESSRHHNIRSKAVQRTITNISQSQFDSLKAEVKQRFGIAFDGNKGEVESHGFRAGIQYDPEAQEVVIVLLKKPWLVPESLVEKKVDTWLSQHGATWLGPDSSIRKT
jgi:hypothetical protein